MSDKIKPSEVSQVLLDQLKGLSTSANLDEVGTVLTVSDGVEDVAAVGGIATVHLVAVNVAKHIARVG